jgi:hypothetical protein
MEYNGQKGIRIHGGHFLPFDEVGKVLKELQSISNGKSVDTTAEDNCARVAWAAVYDLCASLGMRPQLNKSSLDDVLDFLREQCAPITAYPEDNQEPR